MIQVLAILPMFHPASRMGYMLHAFIDESGQRGMTPGASDHFVMSAVMFRSHNADRLPDLMARLRKASGRQAGHEMHFNKMGDAHRSAVTDALGRETWIRTASVVVCKRHLGGDLGNDVARYLYPLSLLLERISWVARSHGEVARYTLAHIQRFKLATLREHEASLRTAANQISWPHLDPAGGAINSPKGLEELQLADIVAAATGIAFNPPENTGVVEQSYLEALRPLLYRRSPGLITSYGMKMHPWRESTKAAYPWVATL